MRTRHLKRTRHSSHVTGNARDLDYQVISMEAWSGFKELEAVWTTPERSKHLQARIALEGSCKEPAAPGAKRRFRELVIQ